MSIMFNINAKDMASAKLQKVGGKVKTLGKVSTEAGEKMQMAFANAAMYRMLGTLTEQIQGSAEAVGVFNKELTVLQALTKSNGDEIAGTSREMRLLATDTEILSSATAQASVMYKRMGRDLEETMSLLPDTLDLITASGKNSDLVVQSVGSTMKSFGIEVEYANSVMNTMLATSENSAQDFGDLAEAMKEVAPVAKELGVSFEETNVLIAQAANLGFRGTRGGNSVKNLLLNMLKPSEAVAEEMKKLDLAGMNVQEMFAKVGENTSMVDLLDTLNKRAITLGLSLQGNEEDYIKMFEIIASNRNIVEEMSDTMRDNFVVQLESSGKLVKELGVNFVAAFQEVSDSDALESINNHLRNVNRQLIQNPEMIQGFADGLVLAGKAGAFLAKNLDVILAGFVAFKAVRIYQYIRNGAILARSSMVSLNATMIASTTITGKLSVAMKMLASSNAILAVVTGAVMAVRWIDKLNESIEMTQGMISDWTEQGIKIQREFYSGWSTILDKSSADMESHTTRIQELTTLERKAWNDRNKMAEEKNSQGAQRANSEYRRLHQERTALIDELNQMKMAGVGGIGFNDQAVVEELKKYTDNMGYKWAAVKSSLVFTNESGTVTDIADMFNLPSGVSIDIEKSKASIDASEELLKKKEELILKSKTDLQYDPNANGDGDGDPMKRSVERISEAINMSEELNTLLAQAGHYKMFEGYQKQIELTGKSVSELNEKEQAWVDKFNESDLGKREDFLRGTGSAISEFSAQVADTQGVEAYLRYLNTMDEMFIEIKGNVEGSTQEFDRFFEVSKQGAQENVVGAFNHELKDTKETLGTLNFGFFTGIERSGKASRDAIASLAEQLESLRSTASPERMEEMTSIFSNFESEEFAERVQGNIDSMSMIVDNTLEIFNTIYTAQQEEMDARHERAMNNLQLEHDQSLRLAGDNAIRKGLIEQDYEKKRKKLQEEQNKEALELARKQKVVAMTTTAINTATAAMGAAAFTPGGGAMRAIAAGSMITLGAVQMGAIASQKFAKGSLGRVDDRGNSDMIPAMLSAGEVVTDSDTVDRLGGYEGFSQMISQAISGINSGGGSTIYQIGTVIGEEEYVRNLFKMMKEEDQEWHY